MKVQAASTTTGKISNPILLVIVFAVIHCVLAFQYAQITPYHTPGRIFGQVAPDIGAPDELQHANLVQWYNERHGLPTFDPKRPDFGEHYEDHQPPLYYVLDAAFESIEGLQQVGGPAAHQIRYLNCLIGALTVLAVGMGTFWATSRADVSYCAAGIASFLPMNCAMSGAVSNDPLLICLVSWVLAIIVRGNVKGWSTASCIGAGVLGGLAMLTKTSAIVLFPVYFMAMLMNPKQMKFIAGAMVIALMFGLPLWGWNFKAYGDPFAMKAFKTAFEGSPKTGDMINQLAGGDAQAYWKDWFGWWSVRSFFGVFGYMNIFMNESGGPMTGPGNPNVIYRLLMGLFAIACLGWPLAMISKEQANNLKSHFMLGIALVAVVGLYVVFNLTYFQAQARYMFPAMLPLCAGFALGWFGLTRPVYKFMWVVLPLSLLGMNLYALSRLPGEFAKRALPPGTQITAPLPANPDAPPTQPGSAQSKENPIPPAAAAASKENPDAPAGPAPGTTTATPFAPTTTPKPSTATQEEQK